MRSILIVDDEEIIVQGILSAMPWDDLNIGPAYSANSMLQAISIFEEHPIDILLCDIEMPQGSGLELLSWAKENSPQTTTVLLTSHADFEYAKQALRLGCSDYLLKPIPYEKLESILRELVGHVERDRQNDEYYRLGRLWEKNSMVVETQFWTDLIHGAISTDINSIIQAAERSQVSVMPEALFFPVLVSMKKKNIALEDWKDEILSYSICNLADETVMPEESRIPVLKLSYSTYVMILDRDSLKLDPNISLIDAEHGIRLNCQQLMQNYQRYLDSQFACYMGEWTDIRGLPKVIADLQSLDHQNVAYFNEVMTCSKPAWRSEPPEILNTLHWTNLLLAGNTHQILQEATHYLDVHTAKRQMNASILRTFYLNFIQVIYAVLAQKGTLVHQLFHDETAETDDSMLTVDQMKTKIKAVLSQAEKSLDIAVHSKSLIEQLKEYIQQHLDQDLTCEDLGNHFYLHADHLTRVLKKETGQSLNELIVSERIKVAQKLLSNSSLPISQIAVHVGYTNVSHFTRMFKRLTGENPVVWRKNAAERKN